MLMIRTGNGWLTEQTVMKVGCCGDSGDEWGKDNDEWNFKCKDRLHESY